MSVLSRYISGRFIASFFVVLAALTSLSLAFELMDRGDQVLRSRGGAATVLLQYAGLRLPDFMAQSLPIAALLGATVTLGMLMRHSELIAVWSSGISPAGIIRSLLPAGALLMLFQFGLDEKLVPNAYADLRSWQIRDFPKAPLVPTDPLAVWVLSGSDIIRIPKDSARARTLTDVTIFQRDDQGVLTGQINATRAEPTEDGWRLLDVRAISAASPRETWEPVRNWQGSLELDRLSLIAKDFRELTLAELSELIRQQGYGQRPTELYRTWFYARLGAMVQPLLMIALVVSLVRTYRRTGSFGQLFLTSLGVGFAYFVFDRTAFAMGEAGFVAPLVAAWSPKVALASGIAAMILRDED
jgi:lipopolysaccharide export system permease protein